MGKITINDVARAAGVSKATVSYVLNGRRSGCSISDKTMQKVLESCLALNYSPDEAAVLLANRKKEPVKLLFLSPWLYSQFSDFMEQVNMALREKMLSGSMHVTCHPFISGKLHKALNAATLRRYEAILLVGTSPEDNLWLQKNAANLSHVVLLNREVEGFFCSRGNDEEASFEAVEAIGSGYYKNFIAFPGSISGYCNRCRCRGFSGAVEKQGKKVEISNVDSVNEIMAEILERSSAYSSPLLAFIPMYASAAMIQKLALDRGIRIPEELGIISYDQHSLLSKFISPVITTIDPDLPAMISAALDMVMTLREKKSSPETKITKAKIIIGQSTINRKEK